MRREGVMQATDYRIFPLKPGRRVFLTIVAERKAYYLIESAESSYLAIGENVRAFVRHPHKESGIILAKWKEIAAQLQEEVRAIWGNARALPIDIEVPEFSIYTHLMSILLLPDWQGLSSLSDCVAIRTENSYAVVYGGALVVGGYINNVPGDRVNVAMIDLLATRKLFLEMKRKGIISHYAQFCQERIGAQTYAETQWLG